MKIITLQVGMMGNNCYLVYDENRTAVCIDPGFDAKKILNEIKINELSLEKIILTHGHFDHISAAEEVRINTNAEVIAYRDEREVIENDMLRKQFRYELPKNVTYIGEEAIICGSLKFKVIHTPGHTKGGICLLADNCLFSGDTIFKQYIGRCDMPTGDIKMITNSIINKIFTLPAGTVIYPGHNASTTVGYEKSRNEVYRWL